MSVLPDEIFSNVWLLARPLLCTSFIPPLTSLSDGKYPLCHWAVLITNLSVDYIQQHFENRYSSGGQSLGTLYELQRADSHQYSVNIIPFPASALRSEWRRVSNQWLGVTTKSNDEISVAGSRQYLRCTN
jgi:hypothetical protein